MNEQVRQYLLQWKQKANEDILTIQRLSEGKMTATSSICFHCQQVAEKYLKLYLLYHGIEIVRTHEIEFLLHECAKVDKDFETVDPKNLSDFGVAIRYPDDFYLPSEEESLEYIELAMAIKDMVEQKIELT